MTQQMFTEQQKSFFKSEESTVCNVAINISLLLVNVKLNNLAASDKTVISWWGEREGKS